METIEIASSPKIGLTVQFQGDTLQRISLFRAPLLILESPAHPIRDSLITWLKNYAQGKWSIFPLHSRTTAFTQKAAAHLQSIPPGKLITYQELAAAIGSPRAARAVGSFCSRNLFPLLIPCHRVIPSSGRLGAFTPDPRIKEELLQFEGITF